MKLKVLRNFKHNALFFKKDEIIEGERLNSLLSNSSFDIIKKDKRLFEVVNEKTLDDLDIEKKVFEIEEKSSHKKKKEKKQG